VIPPALATIQARISSIEGRFRPAAASDGTSGFASALDAAVAQRTAATSGTTPMRASSLDTTARITAPAATRYPTGTEIVNEAASYLGTPYVFGSANPSVGLDCSGLVKVAFAKFGIDLPHYTGSQIQLGRPVASLAQARPGDLVFFGSDIGHMGIYLGNGQMLHAPETGDVVRVAPVRTDIVGIRRLTGADAAGLPRLPGTPVVGGAGIALRDAAAAPYLGLFAEASRRTGVSAELLAAVAKVESSFRPDAVSPAGAQGLMQIMPATARGLGVDDPFDPAQAVDGASRMLAGLIEQFGSVPLALAAYNAGPNAVLRAGGVPSAGVQRYVDKVLGFAGPVT
jgi:cell wall-associated NlpC family hydrolase